MEGKLMITMNDYEKKRYEWGGGRIATAAPMHYANLVNDFCLINLVSAVILLKPRYGSTCLVCSFVILWSLVFWYSIIPSYLV